MEYLEGTVLRRILQQRGVIALDEAAKWMAQCCDGLEAAHREGVLHRDVKRIRPANRTSPIAIA